MSSGYPSARLDEGVTQPYARILRGSHCLYTARPFCKAPPHAPRRRRHGGDISDDDDDENSSNDRRRMELSADKAAVDDDGMVCSNCALHGSSTHVSGLVELG